MALQLEDLFYSMPEVAPGIQAGLSAKYEFKEQPALTEETFRRGKLFPHQIWVNRFMTFYERLLLFFSTGTGKTLGFGSSAYTFVDSFVPGVADFVEQYITTKRTNIGKVYVIVRNSLTRDNFENQMKTYLTARGINNPAFFKSHFRVTYFGEFSKEIEGLKLRYPNNQEALIAEIIRIYSNCYFIIDEAQNLRITTDREDAQVSGRKLLNYNNIHLVLQTAKQIKVIVATATPIYDKVTELPWIMNLVLPPGKQMPENIDLVNTPQEELLQYFLGYVSYVAPAWSTAKPIYVGTSVYSERKEQSGDQKISTVYPLLMSPYQQIGYSQVSGNSASYYVTSRHAASLVYPPRNLHLPVSSLVINKKDTPIKIPLDNQLPLITPEINENYPLSTTEGYEKYIPSHIDANGATTNIISPELANIFTRSTPTGNTPLTLLTLGDISIKYQALIQTVRQEIASGNPKVIFAFDEYVKLSGAGPIAEILRANGLTEFTETIQPFEGPPTAPGTTEREPRKGLLKSGGNVPYRFAIIDSRSNERVRDALNRVLTSRENRRGEYVLVVIATPQTREGISVFGVSRFIQTSWPWNQQQIEQSTSRTIRADSHIDETNELRAIARKEGKSEEEISKITASVRVYLYAAIMPYHIIHAANPYIIYKVILRDPQGGLWKQEYLNNGYSWSYRSSGTTNYLPSGEPPRYYNNLYFNRSNNFEDGIDQMKVIEYSVVPIVWNNIGNNFMMKPNATPVQISGNPFMILRDPVSGFYGMYGSDDLSLVQLIHNKQEPIDRIIKFMMSTAVDCYTHRERNTNSLVLKGQTEEKRHCEEEDQIPSIIDFSSYINLYTQELRKAVLDFLTQYFRIGSVLDWNHLHLLIMQLYSNNSNGMLYNYKINDPSVLQIKNITRVVIELIYHQTRITNRWGQQCYLRCNSQIVWIDREYNSSLVVPDNSFYNGVLNITDGNNIFNYLREVDRLRVVNSDIIDIFKRNPNIDSWSKLGMSRQGVYENALLNLIIADSIGMTNMNPEIIRTSQRIKDMAPHAFYGPIYENLAEIEALRSYKSTTETYLAKESPIDSGPMIYVNTLGSYGLNNQSKYSSVRNIITVGGAIFSNKVSPKNKKGGDDAPIRVLRMPSEINNETIRTIRWETPSLYEMVYIQSLIRQRIIHRREPWENSPILTGVDMEPRQSVPLYGIYDRPGNARYIRDKRRGLSEKLSVDEPDKRVLLYGSSCKSILTHDLWDILWDLRVPNTNTPLHYPGRDEMITAIKRKSSKYNPEIDYNDERLRYTYNWSEMENNRICDIIFDYFATTNFFYQGNYYSMFFEI